MPAGDAFARADVNVERDAPLLKQLGKRLDAETKRGLLEIVGDDQDSAHARGIVASPDWERQTLH